MGIHNNQKPIIHAKEENSKGHKWALLRNLQTDNCTVCWFNYRYLKYKQAHSTDLAKDRNYKDHPTRQLKAQKFSHFILILSSLCNKIIRILRAWMIVSLDFVEKIVCVFWPHFIFEQQQNDGTHISNIFERNNALGKNLVSSKMPTILVYSFDNITSVIVKLSIMKVSFMNGLSYWEKVENIIRCN